MGVWGSGLYSGDFAMDLRSTVAAVARLPFDPDGMVDILCESEPSAASDSTNEEHTTFWLVVADQFAKRGIACDRVRDKALGIIDAGDDITALEKLGMRAADIRKRRSMLDQLRTRIAAAPNRRTRRNMLPKPQSLLMEVGDVMVYPLCDGKNINPYYASKERNIHYTKDGPKPWKQDGWGALVIIDRGRAFDFLSWYRAVSMMEARTEKPSLDTLRGELMWKLGLPGTCSACHLRKMELEKIGTLAVDGEKLKQVFPGLRPGKSAAVKDISIANYIQARPREQVPSAIPKPGEVRKGMAPTLLGIEQILQ